MIGDDPGSLLSALPAAAGRPLREEVLLVLLAPGEASRIALATIPVPPGAAEGLLHAACVTAIQWAGTLHAECAAVVVYHPDAADLDSLAVRTAATLNVLAEQVHLSILDTLRVTGNRWWSYDCDDPSCCPPEGNPVPSLPTPGDNRP